jgi:hypothetical protein
MGWDGLVIKLLALLLLKGSWVTVLKWGKETLFLNYAFYHQAACRK